MQCSRREALKSGGAFGAMSILIGLGLVKPGDAFAQAWNSGIFDTRSIPEALRAFGAGTPAPSTDILISAPDVAENGAVVPVSVVSRLPNTQQIAYLIDKNPFAVGAIFDFPAGTLPEVQTRIKMSQSAFVLILVKADGRFHVAQKDIRVTIGGCGA